MLQGFRGALLYFHDDPFRTSREEDACTFIPDGLLLVAEGKVVAAGPFEELKHAAGAAPVQDHRGCLLMPGFVDTHIHYPQTEMIASYGEQLLTWLETYTFPEEARFSDPIHARRVADHCLDELLRNGTTTAMVFGTVHPESVDAFFEASEARQLRMIAGKVLMDRNAPAGLLDTPERAYSESTALIERWHNRGRARYAVTPRFAPTSSDAQLRAARRLLDEHAGVYLHTHLAENRDEVAWAESLFAHLPPPSGKTQCGYLDVYNHFGLVGPRSVFAHAIQLEEADFRLLSTRGASIASCPTSNLFLGSGLFPFAQATGASHPVKLGLGTDVGAGTSFGMLQTLNEAYKVAQMGHQRLSPLQAFYLATLGGARALALEDCIGSFQVGMEADFVVLDPLATPILATRMNSARTLAERLFLFQMLGDDRAIQATYVLGKPAVAAPWHQPKSEHLLWLDLTR
ncbi:MAG: guanine deaminase [Holophaga sp.]|nr:guanine deaminase [Holophaga sp.]